MLPRTWLSHQWTQRVPQWVALLEQGLQKLPPLSAAGEDESPLSFSHQTLEGDLETDNHVELYASQCLGPSVSTSGSLHMDKCKCEANVYSGQNVLIRESTLQNLESAGELMRVRKSVIQGAILTHGQLVLQDSSVAGDVVAAGPIFAESSTLHSTLQTHSDTVVLKEVIARDVWFSGPSEDIPLETTQDNTVREMCTISLNAGEDLQFYGYKISATETQTEVVTPEGSTYSNGHRVFGSGAQVYEDYQRQCPKAPTIIGPGWPLHHTLEQGSPKEIPTIYLTNGSHLKGTILFSHTPGTVFISSDSHFTGKLIGGTLIQIESEALETLMTDPLGGAEPLRVPAQAS